jgi:hypothetical protein
MAEEYRVFYQRMGDLKEKYKGVNEDTLKNLFVEGFRSGRKLGFDAGYSKAIGDTESFSYDEVTSESTDDLGLEEPVDTANLDTFDATSEMLDS